VLGLHSNAEIRYNTQSVKSIWRNVIDLQPRMVASGQGMSREEFIANTARELIAKVPPPFDLPDIRRDLYKRAQHAHAKALKQAAGAGGAADGKDDAADGAAAKKKKKKADKDAAAAAAAATAAASADGSADPKAAAAVPADAAAKPAAAAAASSETVSSRAVGLSPTTIVLLQELERWNKLVTKMAESLAELQRALQGVVGMSNELDDLAAALFNGYLPDTWRRLAPQTQKGLGSWMAHFQRRHEQYARWAADG